MEFSFRHPRYASLDSCVLLRIIQNDVPSQHRAAQMLLLNGDTYYVDDVAIMEAVHVQTREGKSRAATLTSLRVFLANSMIVYNKKLFEPIFKDYLARPSLSFDDLVLAARAAETGRTPLYTFDKKFARQSKVAELVPSASNQQE